MGRRWWEWEPVFRLDPRRAALLIVDMQNGFVQPGAPLEVPMARAQVPVIRALLESCRSRGVPVIFTAFCVGPDFRYPFYWAMARQRGLRLEPPASMFAADRPEMLRTVVPLAADVERMGQIRAPLEESAPRGGAAVAFRELWKEIRERLAA